MMTRYNSRIVVEGLRMITGTGLGRLRSLGNVRVAVCILGLSGSVSLRGIYLMLHKVLIVSSSVLIGTLPFWLRWY